MLGINTIKHVIPCHGILQVLKPQNQLTKLVFNHLCVQKPLNTPHIASPTTASLMYKLPKIIQNIAATTTPCPSVNARLKAPLTATHQLHPRLPLKYTKSGGILPHYDLDVTFPRLMIWFEDALFHLPQVVQEIQDRVRGYAKHYVQIKVHADATKDHTASGSSKKASNLIKTIFKMASVETQLSDLSQSELKYTQQLQYMYTYIYPCVEKHHDPEPS
jgi:hypothetical protein